MMPRLALGLLTLITLGSLPIGPEELLTPVEGFQVRSGEPTLAFNGKNLDGFYTFLRFHKQEDPDRVFSVRDGQIHITGREVGGLTTKGTFSNYHLIAEWKWGGQTFYPRRWLARNSGILVHGSGEDGSALGFCLPSVECQILEGGTGDLIVVPAKGQEPSKLTSEVRYGPDRQSYYQPGGEKLTREAGRFNWLGRDPEWKDVLWFVGKDDVENRFGEWNRVEIVCDGDRITYVVNGQVVNVGFNSTRTSGKIMIQSEGAEIIFRKFEIRPLLPGN